MKVSSGIMIGSESQSNIVRHDYGKYREFENMRLTPEEIERGDYGNPYYLMMAVMAHENEKSAAAAAMTGVNVGDIHHSLGRMTMNVFFLDKKGRAWMHGLPSWIDDRGFWRPRTQLTIRRQDPNQRPDRVVQGYLLPYVIPAEQDAA